MSTTGTSPSRTATFFDVDGTLARTTIVHYYMYSRRRGMSPLAGAAWQTAFFLKCGYYLVLDKISRSKLNVVFYRSYAGLPVHDVKGQVRDCYREVIQPRRFAEAVPCVWEHRRAGRDIVLVTGALDFIIEPLALELGATRVIAASLVESNGRFTGELDGPPIGGKEKARRMIGYAEERQINLPQSHAYGDSIADLPMLEVVGFPHAVNPDRALATKAKARGWPIHRWTVVQQHTGSDPP